MSEFCNIVGSKAYVSLTIPAHRLKAMKGKTDNYVTGNYRQTHSQVEQNKNSLLGGSWIR
jgi:hypothetical protein